MANIRVKQAIEKLDVEINKVAYHAAHYSGIARKDAAEVKRLCADIATTANQLIELANNPV